MNDSAAADARRFALKLLRYRGRSEEELSRRLQLKGYPDHIIKKTVDSLKAAGLVNNKALARSLTEIAINVRFLGNRGIYQFLRSRGIRETDLPEDYPDYPDELGRALILCKKRSASLSAYPLQGRKRKMRGYLMRKGYSGETIHKALNIFFDS